MWAAWGHCDKEGGYTQIKCKKSCNICEGGSDGMHKILIMSTISNLTMHGSYTR